MELAVYFDPVEIEKINFPSSRKPKLLDKSLIHTADRGFPDMEAVTIALIGVPEERGSVNNKGCAQGPDHIRQQLYQLFPGEWNLILGDLGNIKRGHSLKDTFFALSTICEELLKAKVIPLILGGSQDITWGVYQSFQQLGQIINITSVDSRFDLGEEEEALTSESYLSKILLQKPNYLFNYTNIGYQSYYVDRDTEKLMNKLYFDIWRLGNIRADIEEAEPLVRNADLLTIDISAIRQSEAPGNRNAGPNGFSGEEMCQIMRYAGLSDKLSVVGLFEYNPSLDRNAQTAALMAQMIWYFCEGYTHRKKDFPYRDERKKDYVRYVVPVEGHNEALIFYKSKKSNRWWMEVECPSNAKARYERHFMLPCTYKDYETACANDIPDRWWKAYQKMM
ncbi:MAG: arginase [Bacteroidetes bacterium]|nr:MAG: arginase [Bacteroidota bacterium]